MLDILKSLLGERAASYTDDQLQAQADIAAEEVRAYLRRDTIPECLKTAVLRVAVLNINRTGSEGLSAQGYSATSETYINDYPADLRRRLDPYRKIKIL